MKSFSTPFLFASTLGLLTACGGGSSDSDPGPDPKECTDASTPGCLVSSDSRRLTTPEVTDEELGDVSAGNTRFAFDLYQEIRDDGDNLFFSPYSISVALAMTWAGARGDTESQMKEALGFALAQDRQHNALNFIDLELASRGEGAKGKDDAQPFRLEVTNAVWGQIEYPWQEAFLDTLALNYGAGLHVVDFVGDAEGSRQLINDWVEERTEDRVKDLLPPGSIDALTRMVLTNAIYFNASWATPFDPASTQDGPFTKLDGSTVTAPMMAGSETMPFVDGDGYKAVAIPYDGNELDMAIVVPDEGTFEAFDTSLDANIVQQIASEMTGHQVVLTMPKFEYEADFGLKQPLERLGMPIAFTPDADFTGMATAEQLFIKDVLHKAFVAVDENGTEAAAATAVIVGTTSAPPPGELDVNRPFVFWIRDKPTGTVLFVGRVLDPTAE